VVSLCAVCNSRVERAGFVPAKTCSRECAAELRRQSKPITKDELIDLYVNQKMGTTQIGKIVRRDSKRVYQWLVDWNIPTREKWHGNIPPDKPFHDREWLRKRYHDDKLDLSDIARKCNVCPGTVFRYMRKFNIPRRTCGESVLAKGRTLGLPGNRNGMYGRTGCKSPTWKGGCTPERQSFYQSQEWKKACSAVWKRDDATCQRCLTRKQANDDKYCVHHIVSFSVRELRAEVSNLVLLCDKCHRWVHSKKNVSKQFIGDVKCSAS
jgi:hypothetical protein